MRDFKIITTTTNEEMLKQVDNGNQEANFDLYNEQEQELKSNCFDNGFNTPILATSEGRVYYFDSIESAIETCLSMKEGADLVEFDNGNIGFVGYYGNELTSFEIIRQATNFDQDFIDSFLYQPTIEEYNKKAKELAII